MARSILVDFVEAALRAGAGRAEVERALADAGWSSHQIRDALAAWADVAFVVPVPRPRPELSARDAFAYLVTFGTLYLSAWHFGNLLFQFVDLAFPSELGATPESAFQRIRWALATLIVAFPVFLFASWRTGRTVSEDPARRASPVRRWLIYLTLTIAAFVVLGDAIALLHSLLSGELTVRFLMKVLVVGLIAGAGFAWFLWTVRRDDEALGR